MAFVTVQRKRIIQRARRRKRLVRREAAARGRHGPCGRPVGLTGAALSPFPSAAVYTPADSYAHEPWHATVPSPCRVCQKKRQASISCWLLSAPFRAAPPPPCARNAGLGSSSLARQSGLWPAPPTRKHCLQPSPAQRDRDATQVHSLPARLFSVQNTWGAAELPRVRSGRRLGKKLVLIMCRWWRCGLNCWG